MCRAASCFAQFWVYVFQKLLVTALRLDGEIDVSKREGLRKALEPSESAQLAIIDVSALAYFDLTLINGLIHLRNRMLAQNAASTVCLVGVTPSLRKVLDLTGLAEAFEFRADCAPEPHEVAEGARQG